MDEHDVGLAGGERLQPGAHRILPGRTPEYRRKQPERGGRALERVLVVGMNDRLDERNLLVTGEYRQRPLDRGPAGYRPVLLGDAPAGAQAAPGCDHHCCDGCHLSVRTPFGGQL